MNEIVWSPPEEIMSLSWNRTSARARTRRLLAKAPTSNELPVIVALTSVTSISIWWVRTRWGGNKKNDRKIGSTKADRRQADEIAKKVNAAVVLGSFQVEDKAEKPLPCDAELRQWHLTYGPVRPREASAQGS